MRTVATWAMLASLAVVAVPAQLRAETCLVTAGATERVTTRSFGSVPVPQMAAELSTDGATLVLIALSMSTRVIAVEVPGVPVGRVTLVRDGRTVLATYSIGAFGLEVPAGTGLRLPVSATAVDQPPAGTHRYEVLWRVANPDTELVASQRSLQLVSNGCQ
jgi:hypothetical protein